LSRAIPNILARTWRMSARTSALPWTSPTNCRLASPGKSRRWKPCAAPTAVAGRYRRVFTWLDPRLLILGSRVRIPPLSLAKKPSKPRVSLEISGFFHSSTTLRRRVSPQHHSAHFRPKKHPARCSLRWWHRGRFQESGIRNQSSGFRFQVSGFRFQTSDFRNSTAWQQ
jgi:hypothetical protein